MKPLANDSRRHDSIEFSNSSTRPMVIVLEPWADRWSVPPDSRLILSFSATAF